MGNPKSMHITVIRHSIRNRGGDKLVLDYIGYLISKGHQITYWSNEINTPFKIDPKVELKKIPFPGILGTLLFTSLTKFKSDIVLVDLIVMASCASLRNKEKLIYLAQDYDVTYHRPVLIKKLTELCYRLVLQKYGIPTISVSEGLAQKLNKYTPRNLQTIPNGVDCGLFLPNPKSGYQQKREHPFVILLFARKDFRKGLDVGKKALETLVHLRPTQDWEVWTIGEENLTFDKIAVKNFGFIKNDEDLRDILSAVDIYFVPSRSEGLSLLLLQALACECAIVTTTASSIVEHEVNALVSPIEDWQCLANNLKRVLDESELRERLKRQARVLAQQYSLEKSCERFEKIITTSYPDFRRVDEGIDQ